MGLEVGLGEGYTEGRVRWEIEFGIPFSPVSVMY